MRSRADHNLTGVQRLLVVFLASGAFTGYSPVAPGTVGTLVAVPLALPLSWLCTAHPLLCLPILLVGIGACCWVAGVAEVAFGQHDSRRIVIDEIAGYLVAVAYLPPSPVVLAAAFLIFRFFDVVKPYPASWVDRNLPGGAGVVLDDVVAGLYSNLVLHALFFTGFLA